MGLRFDRIMYISRGLFLVLRDDQGKFVGAISSCFVSSNRGAFSRNLSDGYLTAQASLADENGKDVVLMVMPETKCRTRAAAYKAVREWIKGASVRDALLTAARQSLRLNIKEIHSQQRPRPASRA